MEVMRIDIQNYLGSKLLSIFFGVISMSLLIDDLVF